MIKKHLKVKQFDTTDCGAACLSSVCAYYGLLIPIMRIRQYAFTNQLGTNILGMIEAASKLGLSAKGIKAQIEVLYIISKPIIAHITIKEKHHHYIVIYRVNQKKKQIVYMDPADGEMHTITNKEFEKIWTGVLIIIKPTKTFCKNNQKTNILQRFTYLLLPYKKIMAQAIFGAFIYSLLGLSTSVYIGKITDYVLVDKNINLLNLLSILMIFILLLRTFVGSMKNILVLKTGQLIDAALILGYYQHILSLPQQFFDTMKVGEIISRVNDAIKIRNFINNVSLKLIVDILIFCFSFAFMFLYSRELAIIVAGSIPLFILIYYCFNYLNKKYQRRIMESFADWDAQLIESIHSISTIKQFGVEDYANLKTEVYFVKLLKNLHHSGLGNILIQNSVQFISTALTIVILWLGSRMVICQELTPGELMIFYSLINCIIPSITSLIVSNQTIQEAFIASERLFQIIDLECEENNSHKIILEPYMVGDIIFDSITFRYGTHKEIFKELDLKIEKGKTTAIVGESGSGKSTLGLLIQHIYPIQKGTICIGSYDVNQIDHHSLRKLVVCVPQKVELFAGTIIENIALGDFNPNVKKINDLIELLGLKSFINELPNGVMTSLSEQGTSLSGGERQKIAIARALYKEPEILILDEATSSLDNLSELHIKQVLCEFARKGKTVIIIAHRLTTVKNADKIIVLDKGKIMESGTHQELYKAKGLYYYLWQNGKM